MSIDGLAYGAEESADTTFETPRERTIAAYERELNASANRLRAALARERVLLREKGKQIHQREILDKLLPSSSDAAHRAASLTPRENQIMDLILAGHANKWIAAEIGLSRRTIEHHRSTVMKKTGSKGLAALARFALAALMNDVGETDESQSRSAQTEEKSFC